MDNYLTIEEIEARYAPEWVLIDEPQKDDSQRFLGGRVVAHSPDRSVLFRTAKELGLHHIAIRKLGPWLEDVVLVL